MDALDKMLSYCLPLITLTLVLARDSQYANEYWVYFPRYRATSLNEMGRITSNLFDRYQ